MRSEYLNPELYVELYSVMQRPNVNALRVSLETGLRIDDVLNLTPDQVRADKLRYTAKKTGKPGVARLSKQLRSELLRQSSDLWCFPGKKAGQHRTRQTVYKDLKKACKLLGVEGQISPHSARKTFAVELRKRSGVGAVQRALQHSDVETTNLYAFADVAIRQQIDDCERIATLVVEKIEHLFESAGIFSQKSEKNEKK